MRPARAVALGLLQGPAELLPISSSAHVGLPDCRAIGAAGGAQGDRGGAAPRDGDRARAERAPGGRAGRCWPRRRRRPRWPGSRFERVDRGAARARRRRSPPGLLAGAARWSLADRVPARRRARRRSSVDGAWLGLAQAAALIPGVSRSGATRAARAGARLRPAGRGGAVARGRAAGARRRGRAEGLPARAPPPRRERAVGARGGRRRRRRLDLRRPARRTRARRRRAAGARGRRTAPRWRRSIVGRVWHDRAR